MKDFKENVKDLKVLITTPNDGYFDFCSQYKRKTNESCLFNDRVKRHTTTSSKWDVSVSITFSASTLFVERLKQRGYNIKKVNNKYRINNTKLFWKMIEEGFRI